MVKLFGKLNKKSSGEIGKMEGGRVNDFIDTFSYQSLAVICFGSPFTEMQGNIVPVDYNSSRRVNRNGR